MYEHTDKKTITDFSYSNIEKEYNNGYVFTRLGKGVMQQIKSLRVALSQFELSSENRRILKKGEGVNLEFSNLPMDDYSWEIGKMAKDFYAKFGENVMSANKIKELFTDIDKSNMNSFFSYSLNNEILGYCLCYESKKIVHYSYPFYKLTPENQEQSLGMAMMVKAIIWAKENGKIYIYLGSDNKYKHQFKGLELFDGRKWDKLN